MNRWVRQIHRWLSVVFTLLVIFTFFALQRDEPAMWVSYLPLAPLALLFLSGVYLFALPYASKWRKARPE